MTRSERLEKLATKTTIPQMTRKAFSKTTAR